MNNLKFVTLFTTLLTFVVTCFAFADQKSENDDFKIIGRKINISGISDKIESMTLLPNGTLKTGFRAVITSEGGNQKEAIELGISTKLFDIKVDKNMNVEILPFEIVVEGYVNDPKVTVDSIKASLARLIFSPIGLSGQLITYIQRDLFDNKTTYRGIDFLTVNYNKAINLSQGSKVQFVFGGSATVGVSRFYKPDEKTIDSFIVGASGKVGINIPQKMLLEFYDNARFYFDMVPYTDGVRDGKPLDPNYVLKQNIGLNFAYFLNDWIKLVANFDMEVKFSQIAYYSGYIGFEFLF